MAALAQIRALLQHTMGLTESSIGTATLNRAITRAMTAAKCPSPTEYHRLVQSSQAMMQALIEEVVVPESWFFRDAPVFRALQTVMVPAMKRAAGSRPLRIMSVPCARGEEPYSIATVLLDTLGQGGRFSVTGVDISERSLAYATAAEYGPSAFRERTIDYQARYFEKTARGYRPITSVREHVTFRRANLLSDEFENWPERYDCIFCRNLLIYFDRQMKVKVLTLLNDLLNASGFVVVTPAEATWLIGGCFDHVAGTESSIFSKREISLKTAKQRISVPSIFPVGASAGSTVTPEAPAVVSKLERARALANMGRIDEAMTLCLDYVRDHSTCVEGNYLLGMLHEARTQFDRASECYKRTVYLDPHHADAMLNLALCHERQGEMQAAQQWRSRAERCGRGSS